MVISCALPKRTSLYPLHKELGARIVDFAGWEMPVDFGGIVEEHLNVRARAGLFDVSNMGVLLVEGKDAETLLQRIKPNDV